MSVTAAMTIEPTCTRKHQQHVLKASQRRPTKPDLYTRHMICFKCKSHKPEETPTFGIFQGFIKVAKLKIIFLSYHN